MNAIQKIEPVGEAASLMEVISRAANDPNTNVDKLERLMAMYERINDRGAEQAFNEAMNEAQTAMRPIAADASNPQTKSKYASYMALDGAVRPIYSQRGFSLSFDTGDGAPEGYVRVLCYVGHRAGHSRTYHIDMPADGKGAKGGDVMTKTHATGSGVTYGQRYLLKMIFNIAVGGDDDGNRAGLATGPISESQFKTLSDLLVKLDADIPKFCSHFRIEAVPDLPASKYSTAIEMLNMKGAKK
jgi:hypothetical protein